MESLTRKFWWGQRDDEAKMSWVGGTGDVSRRKRWYCKIRFGCNGSIVSKAVILTLFWLYLHVSKSLTFLYGQKHRQRLTTHEASSPRFKQLQTTRHDRLQTNMHELSCWKIDTYTGTNLYGFLIIMCFHDPMAQLNELRVVDPCFSVSPTPSSMTRFLWTPHIYTYTLSLRSELTESFHFLQYQKLYTICVLVFWKQKRKREWQKKMLVDEDESREASQTQPKFRQWIERWQKSTIKIFS